MAVQAQHPSNIFFLNRAVQEGKNLLVHNFTVHPQPGGDVAVASSLDQPHQQFKNGVNKSRKRAREVATNVLPINALVSMQPQPSQLIDLAQLHTPHHQPNVVSTGLQLSFGDREPQQKQIQSPVPSSLFSDDMASLIKQQMVEIDRFIQAQGDQLRRAVAEKRERQYRALLVAAEESAAKRLMEKEEEVAKAARRNAELQSRASQLSAQAQAWQTRAMAQEAAATSLQAELRKAITASGGCTATPQEREDGEAAGSAAVGREAEDAESAYVDPERTHVPSCKACRRRFASVVVLPCRHLCLCAECDAVVGSCPLCRSIRSSSIEVFLC